MRSLEYNAVVLLELSELIAESLTGRWVLHVALTRHPAAHRAGLRRRLAERYPDG